MTETALTVWLRTSHPTMPNIKRVVVELRADVGREPHALGDRERAGKPSSSG
jgi:hypothetical protein